MVNRRKGLLHLAHHIRHTHLFVINRARGLAIGQIDAEDLGLRIRPSEQRQARTPIAAMDGADVATDIEFFSPTSVAAFSCSAAAFKPRLKEAEVFCNEGEVREWKREVTRFNSLAFSFFKERISARNSSTSF